MQTLLNKANFIVAWCEVGEIDGGIEVKFIPEEVKANCTLYKYIDGEFIKDTSIELEQLKATKLQELAAKCATMITDGFYVGEAHYSFDVNDQANILAWAEQVKAGKSVPYHADGELCRVYTPEEFLTVVMVATLHKVTHQTYFNCLKAQVLALTDILEVKDTTYGETELTGEYKAAYDAAMEALNNAT